MLLLMQEGGRLLEAPISDDLKAFVSSLTYASFHDFEEAAQHSADAMQPLSAWQVEHARAVLEECPELDNLRFVLCPRRDLPTYRCIQLRQPIASSIQPIIHPTYRSIQLHLANYIHAIPDTVDVMQKMCACMQQQRILAHLVCVCRRHEDYERNPAGTMKTKRCNTSWQCAGA